MSLTRLALAVAILAATTGFSSLRAADVKTGTPVGRINEINVDAVPLSKVMDFLRNISGVNLVVNWKSLEGAGVTRDTPITLQVRDLPLRKMLQLVLNQASPNAPLAYTVEGNVIQITTQDEIDKQLVTKVYIVDDLVMVTTANVPAPKINLSNIGQSSGGTSYGSGGGGGGFGGSSGGNSGGSGNGGLFGNNGSNSSSANNQPVETAAQKGQALVDLIKSVIRPNIWKDNGGPADIKYLNGKLVVTAPVSVQEAIGGPVGSTGIRYGM